MAKEATLLFFPALGTNGRIFDRQRQLPYEVVTPSWIDPGPDESLVAYARRLADGIDWPQRPIVTGLSFGGMIAAEIAKYIRPAALIVIASRTVWRSRSAPLYVTNALIQARPDGAVNSIDDLPRRLREVYGDFSPAEQMLFADMLAKESPDRLRRFAHMVGDWPGIKGLSCPILRIHGAADRVIPLEMGNADVVIEGGGHMVNWTHAEEVNNAIMQFVESLP